MSERAALFDALPRHDGWGKPIDFVTLVRILEAAPKGSDWWFDGRDVFYKPEGTNLDQVIIPLPETWHESQRVPEAVGTLVATAVNFTKAAVYRGRSSFWAAR